MIKPTFLLLLISYISSYPLAAQAPNDDIENRIMLQLNAAYASQTNGCTVQWSCVDESLTGKCIDYHNDQWFAFNSGDYSKLYINILGQSCRDLKGVQLVVLKGKPCQVETYNILTCVSLATQDDIYLELDSLEKDQEYLINIDGYLHDFCAFQIEVSEKARGLPLEPTLDLNTTSSRKDHQIRLEWVLPDSLKSKLIGFEIFKRTHPEFRSGFAGEVPVTSNAFGDTQQEYYFQDSIAPNQQYFYTLAAKQADGKLLLIDTFQFQHKYTPGQAKFVRSIRIPLEPVKHKESISIIIYDFQTMKVFKSEVFSYKRKDPLYINYNTYKAIQNNVDKLLVKVINNSSKTTREYTYKLWDD
jgi:hypothetical protein